MKKSNIKLPALVVSKRHPSYFTEGGFYWYVWMKASPQLKGSGSTEQEALDSLLDNLAGRTERAEAELTKIKESVGVVRKLLGFAP